MKRLIYLLATLLLPYLISAQVDRWQQRINYDMRIDFDVDNHQFKGEQKIKYWNNSPDTLHKVFYHLYFNAFQPGSMMDVRSRSIEDPDRRVQDRISHLTPEEIGYHIIDQLKQDGKKATYHVEGTILEVTLPKPIMPYSTTKLEMKFHSQVPKQIRRSGRDNAEGISYSMSQWYPKLAEYDYQGWHSNPYIGREFHGVWGDYKVEIKINGKYTVAASGLLQNTDKVGHGYGMKEKKKSDKKIKWKWEATNVHDFVWGADPDYVVDRHDMKDGTIIYAVYQPGDRTTENWKKLPSIMEAAFGYINERYGQYPYPVYSFIQGGDGGMEYPMATLITGERSLNSLVGVSVHELMHSWYQMVLGTNEALYAWMDEGFTSFASAEVMDYLRRQKLITGDLQDNPQLNAVNGLLRFHSSGKSEPLSIHADHFMTNAGYGVGAYTKGQVALVQLRYIMGEETFYKALKRYYNTWKFKHPNPNDFIRIMEKVSGLELDWFKEYYVYTTHYPDYAISSVTADGGNTQISLQRVGLMPMPLDVVITYTDGTQSYVNIPLRMMRGQKPNEFKDMQYRLEKDWPWTHTNYSFELPYNIDTIKSIEIDPSGNMLDLNRDDNLWDGEEEEEVKD